MLRNIERLYIAIISRFRLAVVFLCNIFLENSSSLELSRLVFLRTKLYLSMSDQSTDAFHSAGFVF
ncbi:hypothetical protein ABWED_3116 [Acinetobacter lwoffii]|nr:hypothetical protein ABWED_3116 [Acinetobacter lwoffii]